MLPQAALDIGRLRDDLRTLASTATGGGGSDVLGSPQATRGAVALLQALRQRLSHSRPGLARRRVLTALVGGDVLGCERCFADAQVRRGDGDARGGGPPQRGGGGGGGGAVVIRPRGLLAKRAGGAKKKKTKKTKKTQQQKKGGRRKKWVPKGAEGKAALAKSRSQEALVRRFIQDGTGARPGTADFGARLQALRSALAEVQE